jgi:hypothetical protein
VETQSAYPGALTMKRRAILTQPSGRYAQFSTEKREKRSVEVCAFVVSVHATTSQPPNHEGRRDENDDDPMIALKMPPKSNASSSPMPSPRVKDQISNESTHKAQADGHQSRFGALHVFEHIVGNKRGR